MTPRPPKRERKREPKPKAAKGNPPRFAPSAFLKGSSEQVQQLCDDLATLAAERFSDLTGTSWQSVGSALAQQLRAIGHDLISIDESDDHQEWQATWHHPRGTFSLLLSFRAPHAVEVTWKADDATFTARR
ncbi:MAG TPA: hypothetical protein VM686_36755 [Polyangiaceae bacterium]|jgi:hypothetical protein|nr:hypothetical protein [Polyangiaceae bacterium]